MRERQRVVPCELRRVDENNDVRPNGSEAGELFILFKFNVFIPTSLCSMYTLYTRKGVTGGFH